MRTFLFHPELRGLTHCLVYRSVALCMALCFLKLLNAQYDQRDFVHYTIKEGLSDNNINCINQYDYGFIWIGTESGLNRYDGNQFEKYFQDSWKQNRNPYMCEASVPGIFGAGDERYGAVTGS